MAAVKAIYCKMDRKVKCDLESRLFKKAGIEVNSTL